MYKRVSLGDEVFHDCGTERHDEKTKIGQR